MKRYLHYDVFTEEAFAGNQLAVFPDARGIDPDLMQPIANEMSFSETTFVLPPENGDTDARMRIFTPKEELPMAGHPTVGSTFALAHEGLITPGSERVTFGLGIGPTPVELDWDGDRLAFAWMVQPVPEFGAPLEDLAALAAGLGLAESDLRDAKLPARIASAGVEFLMVPLSSRHAVDSIVFDRPAMQRAFASAGLPERGVLAFTPEPSRDDGPGAYSRMFAPCLGVAEDPATGSAAGPLGGYLLAHGVVSPGEAKLLTNIQGVHMGRPSRISISVKSGGEGIRQVRVGGTAVLVSEGALVV